MDFTPHTSEGRQLAQERIGLTGRKYQEVTFDQEFGLARKSVLETCTPNVVLRRTEWDPKGDDTWPTKEERYVRLPPEDFEEEYSRHEPK
ncbi:hypothetical protein A2721_02600 [Candidatus Gottesmanbacteria bacterium RIFCSPHIGHO2_01_FULL_47_48]|uniref:Uncharacterized protein n=1 Tax=Candidatus Gottesmanbacteria bacterium RIFCSPHIGHO2_01_FULL_47_48 TaxID=1798381 RepID=A0A1F6A3Y5_9BACT|nr:MAG: hypothetical protein A2721_02600 [Candidatus Gottesmanbacteria bacterium RIFCSPHIGHO2_01_FULL_47_48]